MPRPASAAPLLVLAALLPALTAQGAQAQTLPAQAFYLGLGGAYADADFGRQDVFAVGTSDVYEGGTLVATGTAAGPARFSMPDASGLAPALQGGYFRQAPGGDWVWGTKLSYAYLDASASLRDVRMPQAGEFTTVATGEVTPFTGNAVAQSYETGVTHQFALMPFAGRTFERGFFYLGAGPTLSRVETEIGGLVGFADIDGVRQDISGPPQDFSSSDWVWGGAVTVGVTYFVSEQLFLDLSYAYGRTRTYEGDYSSSFVNPAADGRTTEGTLVGSSSRRLETQVVAFTLNWAF